nr:ceramide glucosyltransferase [Tanacetum cinerariifolium]
MAFILHFFITSRNIIVGPSTICSQKIHNQLVGVENMHKGSKYVLFLDDDVRLHPGSVGALATEMIKNPEQCFLVFIARTREADAQNIDADTDVRSRHVLLLKIVGPILHLMKVHNIQW